jgi:hypothetical protein
LLLLFPFIADERQKRTTHNTKTKNKRRTGGLEGNIRWAAVLSYVSSAQGAGTGTQPQLRQATEMGHQHAG